MKAVVCLNNFYESKSLLPINAWTSPEVVFTPPPFAKWEISPTFRSIPSQIQSFLTQNKEFTPCNSEFSLFKIELEIRFVRDRGWGLSRGGRT